MNWLIEKGVFFDGNPERIAQIVRARGDECRIIRYVDGQPVRSFPPGTRVVAYGSMGFIRDLMRAAQWLPTAWFDEELLSCHHYLTHWSAHYIQKDYRILPLAQVRQQCDELYRQIGADDQLFIRPNDNMKSFAGKAVKKDEFALWLDQNVRCYDLAPSLLCLVARPQAILGEWRFVIADGKVVTSSAYIGETRSSHAADVPQAAQLKAAEIASGSFRPLTIYVMDIGQTAHGFHLMEIGSVNCASLYAGNLEKLVDVMRLAAERT